MTREIFLALKKFWIWKSRGFTIFYQAMYPELQRAGHHELCKHQYWLVSTNSKQKVAIVKLPESSFTSEFKTHIHTTHSIVFSGSIIFGLMNIR